MKTTVLILALVAAVSAQFGGNGRYRPFGSSTPAPIRYRPAPSVSVTPASYSITPAPLVYYASSTPRPIPVATRVVSDARNAEILKYGNDVAPDGAYNYFYETSNGIAAQEQGTPRVFGGNPPVAPVVAQGSYSYISPEGIPIAITYVADENGFHPSGAALPTPPPIPPQIARALEYIARNAPRQ